MNIIKRFLLGLAFAAKRGDEILTYSNKTIEDEGSTISQKQETDCVYNDLVKGEITQEVKNVRHSMYRAERESKKYKHIGNGISIKVNDIEKSNTSDLISNDDNLEMLFIQPNSIILKSMADEISDVSNDLIIKEVGISEEFTLKIDRDFNPRFRLEKLAKKLVVFDFNETEVILDFYVSNQPDNLLLVKNLVISEIKRIINGNTKSDIISFNSVEFITYNAIGVEDLMFYRFDNLEYKKITEYDGNYIISFIAKKDVFHEDLTEEFFSQEQEDRYTNKESKNKSTLVIDHENIRDKSAIDELNEIKELLNNKKIKVNEKTISN